MKKEFVIMYCNSCNRHYRYDDEVVLDEMNGIIHTECYQNIGIFEIKDFGTYGEIIERYDFFEDQR